MSDFGIICEVNPLHGGHRYLIESARSIGAGRVVCVMSGNTVQRGEFAVTDKYARAEMLIANGADLVLELPFPWCSGSAEQFSRGAISILKDVCDTVIFGSECGDIELICRAATLASSEEFREEYRRRTKSGEGAASAYFSLLSERVGIELSSNDILGVEYIKAAKKLGAELDFYTVARKGSAYRESSLEPMKNPSATALRNEWRSGRVSLEEYMPSQAIEGYERAFDNGEITDNSLLERAYLMFFRLSRSEDLSGIAEAEGGIADRLCLLARESKDFESFWDAFRTKRYTDAKLMSISPFISFWYVAWLLLCLAGF